MNDSSEGKILSRIVEKFVQHSEKVTEDQKREYIQHIRDRIYNNVFSFSLTTEYDDAPQWERYTRLDTGVCLVTSIDKIGKLTTICSNHCHFNYGPVCYTDSKTQDGDYSLLCNLFRTDASSKSIDDNLPTNSAFIKCSSFKNEREVRLVIERSEHKSDSLFTYKYSNTLAPYVLFNMNQYCLQFNKGNNFFENFFDKIIIGPQSLITEENLRKYLELNKIKNIDVETSTSHLRR